jgi:hypothetical protein
MPNVDDEVQIAIAAANDADLAQRLLAVTKDLEQLVNKLEAKQNPPKRPKLDVVKGGRDAE